jgi:hypothetical protein
MLGMDRLAQYLGGTLYGIRTEQLLEDSEQCALAVAASAEQKEQAVFVDRTAERIPEAPLKVLIDLGISTRHVPDE